MRRPHEPLIPEIEKVASYAGGKKLRLPTSTPSAHHIPEADVFEMSEALSRGDMTRRPDLLSELLAGEEPPIKILAILGGQMRRLYTARVALDRGLGAAFVKELCALRFDFIAQRLLSGARRLFPALPPPRPVYALRGDDYRMKSSSDDDGELLKELMLRLAVGGPV
jgi:DNA polymerase-3 subunit delta